jgi:hypothetical protein
MGFFGPKRGNVSALKSRDIIQWLAEKGLFMISKKFPHYPIRSDTSLWLDGADGKPKSISYGALVSGITELVKNNTRDEHGNYLLPLDIDKNVSHMIGIDLSDPKNGFKLVNKELA